MILSSVVAISDVICTSRPPLGTRENITIWWKRTITNSISTYCIKKRIPTWNPRPTHYLTPIWRWTACMGQHHITPDFQKFYFLLHVAALWLGNFRDQTVKMLAYSAGFPWRFKETSIVSKFACFLQKQMWLNIYSCQGRNCPAIKWVINYRHLSR